MPTAIKIITVDEEDAKAIKEEYENAKTLESPNLVKYKGFYVMPAGLIKNDIVIEMTLADCDIKNRINNTVLII